LNPRLARLQPYPFERLRQWFAGVTPNPALSPISLSIGEPRHPTPPIVLDALAAGARGLANYPTTIGTPALREAIAAWLVRRHGLADLDPVAQVLPVLGSREALFAFAQTMIDASRVGALVLGRELVRPAWRRHALRPQHAGTSAGPAVMARAAVSGGILPKG